MHHEIYENKIPILSSSISREGLVSFTYNLKLKYVVMVSLRLYIVQGIIEIRPLQRDDLKLKL